MERTLGNTDRTISSCIGRPHSILCLLPRLSDARIAKRIEMLQEAGYDVSAISFVRIQDSREPNRPPCPTEEVGNAKNAAYLSRVSSLLNMIPKVRRSLPEVDCLYAFGPDLAGVAVVAALGTGKPTILEVADIQEVQTSDTFGGVVARHIEKATTPKVSGVVLTSDQYREYYSDWLGTEPNNILLLENKHTVGTVEAVKSESQSSRPFTSDRPLTIGWVGILRFEWTLSFLKSLSRYAPNRFRFYLAGTPRPSMPLREFRESLKGYDFEYHGPYLNPKELGDIYDRIDIATAIMPTTIPLSWSRTNRYYEACLFQKPMILRAGTADANRASTLGVGCILESRTPEMAAIEFLSELRHLPEWQANVNSLPLSEYALTTEVKELNDMIHATIHPSKP